mgnify:CR=1 FL=1
MDKSNLYKPVADYYKYRVTTDIPSGTKNTAILKRIQNDISQLQGDINTIKADIQFIKEYIINKKEREDNKWFY